MKPFPVLAFNMRTALTLREVQQRLSNETEAFVFMRLPLLDDQLSQHKYFEGECRERDFNLRKMHVRRNDLRPVIIGRVEPDAQGSIVSVHMRPFLSTAIFIATWALLCGAAVAAGISGSPQFGSPTWPLVPIGLGGLAFIWLLVHVGFWEESESAKAYLDVVLDAERGGGSA